jgi:hypothetical protein
MSKGYLALLLHAHLPFVRHPEHEEFFEEDWLFEAITETYIPILKILRRMATERVPVKLTLTMSPPLCAMLRDPLLRDRAARYATVTALDEDLALSIRPSYIFGNSDQFGEANNEGAFQMPVTLDFAPNYWVSPYIGIGIATNTDSNGSTDLLLSAGLDFRLTKNISIVTGLNYIRQTDDADSRDIEGITVLYLRF